MFKKVLIANRGEIAVRIIRGCREMDIETVAVYSTADESALHTQLATSSVCIGPAKASDSYLNMQNILSAALNTGCDAIHPGFGFLSENSDFARLCKACGLVFIGPDYRVIDSMGNKSAARELMKKSGVPVVPGSDGSVLNVDDAKRIAGEIGYPVLIKASAGGGGRGIRQAWSESELEEAFSTARAEARACFGDDDVYIEKLIVNPSHIEFQILADNFGNVVHLGERDCSIQRRSQKMMEEAPARLLTPKLREEMGAAAVRAAESAGYTNAGTVEFVVDGEGNFYFIEMNTRIQVEHPVTEMLTGIDLVKEQLRISAGLPLSFKQEDVCLQGHAIECRINAEDPSNQFRPCAGEVSFLHFPGGNGTRVDSAAYSGCEISPFYDSMIAKIIVCAPTRLEAIRKMRRALEETTIEGICTNLELCHLILFDKDYVKGNFDTGYLDRKMPEMLELYEKSSGECERNSSDGYN